MQPPAIRKVIGLDCPIYLKGQRGLLQYSHQRRDGRRGTQDSGSEWHQNACSRERRGPCRLVPSWLPRALVLLAPPDSGSQRPRVPRRGS